jgi:hypothetical protein
VSRRERFTGQQQLVFLAGFALIALGIVCLYLSDAVVTGWWQGTLDAFGVGLIVGGLVDVIAISGLNQAINVQQRRQEANSEARAMLRNTLTPGNRENVEATRDLLRRSGSLLDPSLRRRLDARISRMSTEMERAVEQPQTWDRPPPGITSRIRRWWNS